MAEKNKQLRVWDFTLTANEPHTELIEILQNAGLNRWGFQLEQSDAGTKHYQGRVSFKTAKRLSECTKMFKAHFSPTNNTTMAEHGFFHYITKSDHTYIDGPWTSKDEKIYIPIQYRVTDWRPWQQQVIDSFNTPDYRHINVIVCPHGNQGKSFLRGHLCSQNKAIYIGYTNSFEKMQRATYAAVVGNRSPPPILIDLPRAIDQTHISGLMAGIEEIKNGYAKDDRYQDKHWWFDSPIVWVFMNQEPPYSTMSSDRFIIYDLNNGVLALRCNT